MRRSVLLAIVVGIVVALASRFSEWAFTRYGPNVSEFVRNLVGMSVAGFTAGILFFLWRYQHYERLKMLRDREHAVRHVHHHVRNSLQVIVNRHHEDPLVVQYVDQIICELERALPRRRRLAPRASNQTEHKKEPS